MDQLLCEIRFAIDETRQTVGRLTGTLLTYGEVARDRPELFTRGALEWPPEGIVINEMHNRQAPIVRAVPFLDGDALRIDVALPDTARGRDVATAMRQEMPLYGGLSVEFKALAEGRRNGLREIRRAILGGAGLVDRGAYMGSTVEIRASGLAAAIPSEATLWL